MSLTFPEAFLDEQEKLKRGYLPNPWVASGCRTPPRGWKWAWAPEALIVTNRVPIEKMVRHWRLGPGHKRYGLVLVRAPKENGGSR